MLKKKISFFGGLWSPDTATFVKYTKIGMMPFFILFYLFFLVISEYYPIPILMQIFFSLNLSFNFS